MLGRPIEAAGRAHLDGHTSQYPGMTDGPRYLSLSEMDYSGPMPRQQACSLNHREK